MDSNARYYELCRQYREYAKSELWTWVRKESEQSEQFHNHVSYLRKELQEFCVASGRDLKDLNQFFQDVDAEIVEMLPK